ncbi:UvrD-helicase domain-containing protein [Rhizobium sp. PAMB 3174]
MYKYILITELALDAALIGGGFSDETMLPIEQGAVHRIDLPEPFIGYRVANETEMPIFALVGIDCLELLKLEGGRPSEAFRRIARVLKGVKSPPVHLPRQWFEYHYKNLLAFFALPREASNVRWVVDFGAGSKFARFDFLTSEASEVDLARFAPTDWPVGYSDAATTLLNCTPSQATSTAHHNTLSREVDLETIGSASIVHGRAYEEWERYLTDPQRDLLTQPIDTSLRIVGPAGSGKTLSLCMRALQVSRDQNVISQGKRLLVATHSWAMSERIDGVLNALNGGLPPEGITVFPLLSLLELHAGHIGQRRTDVIGDDSTDGRLKSLEIISEVLSSIDVTKHPGTSKWIADAMTSSADSRARLELVVNLYEELSGVLTASGVSSDDNESIREYINAKREDWMPPFPLVTDRGMVISVYKLFMQNLIDRSAITTDQFIIDSIRVLETFTWRMRKETDGYDYIFVDELQLFDPQERAALELLGRQKKGVPFITAEDPSQGVFSTLNARRASVDNVPVYLDTVHRFNREIFEFIAFIYQKFPLNALPLKIHDTKVPGNQRPTLYSLSDDVAAVAKAVDLVATLSKSAGSNERICVVTLGDVDAQIITKLEAQRLQITRLSSFDDVEQLSYSKKSIVVSPWEFIGGTQFSHVVVIALGINAPSSQFSRLREMISIYLASSRAAETLSLICNGYIPQIIVEATENGLVERA